MNTRSIIGACIASTVALGVGVWAGTEFETGAYLPASVTRPSTKATATPKPPVRLPACPHEDAPGPCLWDARIHGNRQGESFVALPADPSTGTVDERVVVQPDPRPQPGPIEGHTDCALYLGDTSVVVCRDGWVQVS